MLLPLFFVGSFFYFRSSTDRHLLEKTEKRTKEKKTKRNEVTNGCFLQGIMSSQLSSLLFLVVGLSMALTPWLAAGGQLIASRFEQHDVRSLLPVESEVKY